MKQNLINSFNNRNMRLKGNLITSTILSTLAAPTWSFNPTYAPVLIRNSRIITTTSFPIREHAYRYSINTNTNISPKNHQYQNTRLYGSKSFLGNVGDKIKSVFKKEKGGGMITSKKEQTKQDVSSSIDTMLKDAPLGVRMMGKMVKPLISSVVGNLAQAMEEQTQSMNEVLDNARDLIVRDGRAIEFLGEPIEVGSPFSQSSSSMSVNGKTSSSIQATVEVRGSRGTGVATISATDGQIQTLNLNVAGRNIPIDTIPSANASADSWTSSQSPPSSQSFSGSKSKRSDGLGKNSMGDDNIIDVEFVDKKVSK
jgi:hypothetical protein